MTEDELDDIHWFSPAHYYTRCPDDLATGIARDIVLGASWQMASAKYGVRHRFRDWMRWGAEAAERDAGAEDSHAQYLNLFLKVQQAMGIAGVAAEQMMYRQRYDIWLQRHPEARVDWGDGNPNGSLLLAAEAGTEEVVEAAPEAPTFEYKDPEEFRQVLKYLAEAGAAIPPSLPEPPASAEEGSGTNG